MRSRAGGEMVNDDLQVVDWSHHRANEKPKFGVAVLTGDEETLLLTVEMTPDEMIDLATALLKNAADSKKAEAHFASANPLCYGNDKGL